MGREAEGRGQDDDCHCRPPARRRQIPGPESLDHYLLLPLTPSPLHKQAMLPLLKYVKGEVLSQEHWHEMFLMLGFPRGTTLERLSFGDVLSHAEEIVANADKLKELYR